MRTINLSGGSYWIYKSVQVSLQVNCLNSVSSVSPTLKRRQSGIIPVIHYSCQCIFSVFLAVKKAP
jgi:hypothetical protein